MHLTETAYGDIAEYLLDTVSGRAVVDTAGPLRKRLESILTRSASDPLHKPMPGWIVGGNQGGARGRDQGRGLPGGLCGGRGRGSRRKPAQWRSGPGGRWAPLLKSPAPKTSSVLRDKLSYRRRKEEKKS